MLKENVNVSPIDQDFDVHNQETYRKLMRHLKSGEILHIRFDLEKDDTLSRPKDFKTFLSEMAAAATKEKFFVEMTLTDPDSFHPDHKSITLTFHRKNVN